MTDVQNLIESIKVHIRRDSLANVNWLLVEQVLANALAKAQRETWEAAAKGIMNFSVGININILKDMTKNEHTIYVSKAFASWCRQQVKK